MAAEDPLVTLEGDKATMDIPSPLAGKVISVKIAAGDKVSMGSPIVELEVGATGEASVAEPKDEPAPTQEAVVVEEEKKEAPKAATPSVSQEPVSSGSLHASPAVRRMARELDIDLSAVRGTGNKDRISKEDLRSYAVNS